MGPGDYVTLLASAARTDSTTPAYGSGVDLLCGMWAPKRANVILSCTAHATDAGDTLDVFVDVSPDNITWINAGQFTRIAGDASPAAGPKELVLLSCEGTPGTDPIAISGDAGDHTVRPYLLLRYIRIRWAIADAGANNASHTFSVAAQVF